MKFEKGKPNPGKGREKGIPNKTTMAAKEAIQFAFDKIGGAQGLADWAMQEKNQGEFYKLFAKLLPVQLSGSLEIKTPAIVELPPKKARD